MAKWTGRANGSKPFLKRPCRRQSRQRHHHGINHSSQPARLGNHHREAGLRRLRWSGLAQRKQWKVRRKRTRWERSANNRCGEHNLDFGSARSFAQVKILCLSCAFSELLCDDNANDRQQRRNQVAGCPTCGVVRLQLPPGFGDSLAGPQCEQGTHNIQDDLHYSITHSSVPSTYRARLLLPHRLRS